MDINVLQIKQGKEADRTGYTPLSGELIYTTDNKKLFIGDGSTPGGNGPFATENFVSTEIGQGDSVGDRLKLVDDGSGNPKVPDNMIQVSATGVQNVEIVQTIQDLKNFPGKKKGDTFVVTNASFDSDPVANPAQSATFVVRVDNPDDTDPANFENNYLKVQTPDVKSVNNITSDALGKVILTTDDIGEGSSNLWYTTKRATDDATSKVLGLPPRYDASGNILPTLDDTFALDLNDSTSANEGKERLWSVTKTMTEVKAVTDTLIPQDALDDTANPGDTDAASKLWSPVRIDQEIGSLKTELTSVINKKVESSDSMVNLPTNGSLPQDVLPIAGIMQVTQAAYDDLLSNTAEDSNNNGALIPVDNTKPYLRSDVIYVIDAEVVNTTNSSLNKGLVIRGTSETGLEPIQDLTAAPTKDDFNNLLVALRKAKVIN